jgi:hypothetical protein
MGAPESPSAGGNGTLPVGPNNYNSESKKLDPVEVSKFQSVKYQMVKEEEKLDNPLDFRFRK